MAAKKRHGIPRYKRDKYIFVSNLKEITASRDYDVTLNREAYLLSEQYAHAEEVSLAHWVKKRRNLLISDNGNFSRMVAIARQFKKYGNAILNQALDEAATTGVVAHATLTNRQNLWNDIERACNETVNNVDWSNIVTRQAAINPDYLIGLEDFTIPVLMLCGMMHPVFKPDANAVKIYQQNTLKLYQDLCCGTFGNQAQLNALWKFCVIHAYDYQSAYQGAQNAANHTEGVAISYGGPMTSRRWITEINMGNETIQFPEKLPEAYLAATALTLGVGNGLTEKLPVHILGVGTPILIALIAQMLPSASAISIDSTAPFKDSNVGALYGSRYAFLKMDMLKVAAYALINNKPYSSTTPYFKWFERDYPSSWAAMRAQLGITKNDSVKEVVQQLKDQPDLVEQYIPFFSKMRSGDNAMIHRLRIDRAGHNYWVLRNICRSVRSRLDDRQKLEQWMRYQVERYQKIGSDKWAKAVKAAFSMSISRMR